MGEGGAGGESRSLWKPYEGHESLTSYLRFHAYRAGISDRDFWSMTSHAVLQAFLASAENMSRLAYRTAVYTRTSHKHFPRTEADIFAKMKKPKRQSIADQLAMAKLITGVMSKEVH